MTWKKVKEDYDLLNTLISAVKNSPNIVIDILSSLGYDVVKEDYISTVDVPQYETVDVVKTRQVPCGFPCFYRTETYTETERKFAGYKQENRTEQRYILKKKSN